MFKKIFSLAATAIALSGVVLALPISAGAAPAAPQVSNCGDNSAKPTGIVLTCADANESLEKLTWSTWNSTTAKGSGTYSVNDCRPTCAAGMYHRYKVNVVLSVPKTVKGTRIFTKARVTFPGITDQSNKTFSLG